ncbi:MAG: polysaccharide deacetylase family protein [Sumerlaeia bacterium]
MICLAVLVPVGSAAPAEPILADDTAATMTAPLAPRGAGILMYHGLDEEFNFVAESFRVQMQYLADNGFETITFAHLQSWIETGSPALPKKPIILTYDDNYITIWDLAYPEMKKHGFFGYNFAHTMYVGVVTSYDHADWAECMIMENDGVVFTESHTISHVHLTLLSDMAKTNEILNSKRAIAENMQGKVSTTLSYPYGAYDQRTIEITRDSGYDNAVSTVPGITTRDSGVFELPRFAVNPNWVGEGTALNNGFLRAVNEVERQSVRWINVEDEAAVGGAYQVADPGEAPLNALWTVDLPEATTYTLEMHWPAGAATATDAPVGVFLDGEWLTTPVDQSTSGGAWIAVGTYDFPTTRAMINLSNAANGSVAADAIRLQVAVDPEPYGGWIVH